MTTRRQFLITAIAVLGLTTPGFAQEKPDPYSEPSINYLRRFSSEPGAVFVFERYDSAGNLVAQDNERLAGPVLVTGATERIIAGHAITLRGLVACPKPVVLYNKSQHWDCSRAAADFIETVYNDRASVILCKTLVLRSIPSMPDPSSCFALVGGKGVDPYLVVNDDDAMVFLGLARIGTAEDGSVRRPDLIETQELSGSEGSK